MFDFGTAIKAMKDGKKVQRQGWNEKGMYIYLTSFEKNEDRSTTFKVQRQGWNEKGMYIYLTSFEKNEDRSTTFQPCLVVKTPQELFQPGWLASQADMLAEDWQLME